MGMMKRYLDEVYEVLEQIDAFKILGMDQQGEVAVAVADHLMNHRVDSKAESFQKCVEAAFALYLNHLEREAAQ